jgi:hypothetical protein
MLPFEITTDNGSQQRPSSHAHVPVVQDNQRKTLGLELFDPEQNPQKSPKNSGRSGSTVMLTQYGYTLNRST